MTTTWFAFLVGVAVGLHLGLVIASILFVGFCRRHRNPGTTHAPRPPTPSEHWAAEPVPDAFGTARPPTRIAIADVAAERARQITMWIDQHDDHHSPSGWHSLLSSYSDAALHMQVMGSSDGYRRRLVQVAALAVAAIEAHDRASGRISKP